MYCPKCGKDMVTGYIRHSGSSSFIPYNGKLLTNNPNATENVLTGNSKIVLSYKPMFLLSHLESYYCKHCNMLIHMVDKSKKID